MSTMIDVSHGDVVEALPRWDLNTLFAGLDSEAFASGFNRLVADIDQLSQLFDELDITYSAASTRDGTVVARFERALAELNNVAEQLSSMASYLYGHITANSRDELAQARHSALQARLVVLNKAETRFNAWIGSIDVEALIANSSLALAHAYPLRRLHAAANHLMSEPEEALAAELAPSSGSAWSRLHGNLTSQIVATIEIDTLEQILPMSELRNLATADDRALRKRAWDAEISAWEANALPIAAALNGVKGEVIALANRRKWGDPLDQALFESGIDHEILAAMVNEARLAFPDFRRYLHLKARAIGVPALAWYDLFAPVGMASHQWSWSESTKFVEQQFGAFSARLAHLARRAFAERWVDAGPRPGKIGGAYCMWYPRGDSRILMNFSSGYDGVATLAHELGHAYHNLNEVNLTPMQRRTPMILAETASTFCETVVKEAALEGADRSERLYILEQSLQGSCQIVVDILSRFDFERSLFSARQERELSVRELNELMLAAQRGTYGDAIEASTLHPFMWAVKGHYYSTERSFYNFPYLFGLLFGLGLYALQDAHSDSFAERYDALLSMTGRASAADLAAGFGIDLTSPEFWRSSLDVIRSDITRMEELIAV